MDLSLPPSWAALLAGEMEEPYFRGLRGFVDAERRTAAVHPPETDVFNALRLTPYDAVKVLIVGQDPYHGPGQAHGLAFSVRPGVRTPPSLVNVFKELRDDLGCAVPGHGHLVRWARQGVLLLNAVLTVRQGEPNSHKGKGWERFTDAVIRRVAEKEERVVFVLWGSYAQKKRALIDTSRHAIVESVHPSPLSARRGFMGSRPFGKVNEALVQGGRTPVEWCLPPEP